jgi:serine/threonine protein phosphatase PrpC
VQGQGRKRNSDAFGVMRTAHGYAFAVADGVGALSGSAAASQAAVDAVKQWSANRNGSLLTEVDGLYDEIDRSVREALAHEDSGATTLACLLADETGYLLTAIGDSEILAVSATGETVLMNELDHLPNRPNVLLAWIDGKTELSPHVAQLNRLPDRLCLVTDGVTKLLEYERIGRLVLDAGVQGAAVALVDAAREAGAQDDLTAIVISADLFGPRD